ncbi:hypothetical protein CEXT_70051 [Caerostris extrusa]|uniref:Uncharacterized protein n=1 Tax=Caerostris extrusa TaxID=172846 RepID=A0AAV4UH66_CAEEX|nr:hypothetical protein CEXT_70051 [Caerostris extrusa]
MKIYKKILEEKEKANSVLCGIVEKLLSSSASPESQQNILNTDVLPSIVNAVKQTLHKYHKQIEENNFKLSSLNEQNCYATKNH